MYSILITFLLLYLSGGKLFTRCPINTKVINLELLNNMIYAKTDRIIDIISATIVDDNAVKLTALYHKLYLCCVFEIVSKKYFKSIHHKVH